LFNNIFLELSKRIFFAFGTEREAENGSFYALGVC
jgi:hypothetical protein